MTEPNNIVPCPDPGQINIDPDKTPPYCSTEKLDCQGEPEKETLKEVSGRDFSWFDPPTMQKMGIGQSALCDPMLKGYIVNAQGGPDTADRNTIYRYSQALRGTDEAVMNLFQDVVILDELGKAHNIPIIWATQEKAVAYLLQENTRKDDSLVVDRIPLPHMAIHNSDTKFNQGRYCYPRAIDWLRDMRGDHKPGFTFREKTHDRDTVFGVAKGIPLDKTYILYVWTMNREDINQIAEQIIAKLTPMGYIRVRGVSWEIVVKLDSIGNSIEVDPGDKAVNVFKYQFTMVAETYLPYPIVRRKAVLKTRTEIVDAINDRDITQVIARLEDAIKDLK